MSVQTSFLFFYRGEQDFRRQIFDERSGPARAMLTAARKAYGLAVVAQTAQSAVSPTAESAELTFTGRSRCQNEYPSADGRPAGWAACETVPIRIGICATTVGLATVQFSLTRIGSAACATARNATPARRSANVVPRKIAPSAGSLNKRQRCALKRRELPFWSVVVDRMKPDHIARINSQLEFDFARG
jgi:hypothetical protein